MKKKVLKFVLVLFLFGYSSLFSQEKRNNCVECHTELGDEYAMIVENFQSDIHSEKGLSCVDCHGGDSQVEVSEDEPEKAMDPAKGYIGVPDKAEIPDFCGKCHSDPEYMKKFNPNIRIDQVDRFFTSVHGLKLKAGDKKAASCTDCHQSHQTRSKNNPGSRVFPVNISETCGRCHSDTEYMEEYGIPVDQVADYSQSIHYKFLVEDGDLFSPTCNDCHGNHGAVPPGVKSIHNICGTCHFQNNTQFEQSPHAEAFEEMGEPGCSTCHNTHKIARIREEKLGLDEGSVCANCHDEDSEGGKTAVNMKNDLTGLLDLSKSAENFIHDARRKGVEVEDGEIMLLNLNDIITKSRSIIHSFSYEKFSEEIDKGKTLGKEAEQYGQKALKEVSTRRRGLFLFLFFIILVIIGLYMKIRTLE